jgi:cell wall-associated NlpC family hydrolase
VEEHQDKGLGDTIKRATGAVGIKACGGCQRRAELLNRLVPYGRSEEAELRLKVIAEAESFKGTPYVKNGRMKGVGVDCGTFPFLVYRSLDLIRAGEEGIFADEAIVPRSQDWFANSSSERYLAAVLRYMKRVVDGMSYPTLKAEPGNLALTRCVGSKRFNHAGIVVRWPRLLHATAQCGVAEVDASTHSMWSFREVAIFDPFAKARDVRR